MKLTRQIVSYYEPDILAEIERFEEEERRARAIQAEQRQAKKLNAEERRKIAAWEKLNAADAVVEKMHAEARREHAFLLRCEGLSLQQIGDRMDVSRERVRQMLRKASYRVQRAMAPKWPRGRTRFYFEATP